MPEQDRNRPGSRPGAFQGPAGSGKAVFLGFEIPGLLPGDKPGRPVVEFRQHQGKIPLAEGGRGGQEGEDQIRTVGDFGKFRRLRGDFPIIPCGFHGKGRGQFPAAGPGIQGQAVTVRGLPEIYPPETEKHQGIGVDFPGDDIIQRRHVFTGIPVIRAITGSLHLPPAFGDKVYPLLFELNQEGFGEFPRGNPGQQGGVFLYQRKNPIPLLQGGKGNLHLVEGPVISLNLGLYFSAGDFQGKNPSGIGVSFPPVKAGPHLIAVQNVDKPLSPGSPAIGLSCHSMMIIS